MKHQLQKQEASFQLPKIHIPNLSDGSLEIKEKYENIIRDSVLQIIPQSCPCFDTNIEKIKYIKGLIPNVNWDYTPNMCGNLNIRCIYNYRIYSSKFIYDIISRWLIPGKRLNIISSFGSDFVFDGDNKERFIFMQFLLEIETREDAKTIQDTLPIIASEIQVGVVSIDQGMRILEIKGLNVDEKVNLIQESIVNLMSQKPRHFDRGLFSEMQSFFVLSPDNFKEIREYRHLVRIICWQYLFRKAMAMNSSKSGNRLIRTKLMKARLHYPYGAKTVLGVFVGLSQIGDNERFGVEQITKSVQAFISDVKPVEKSFLVNRKSEDLGLMAYVEFEKSNNKPFTFEELSKLRVFLPEDLSGRIEQFMHPIFLPRNEEEVMRNIVNLSRQLKGYGDIPQIMINFESQSKQHITFTVLMLRLIKSDELPVQDICTKNHFVYELIPDQIKIVGQIKKKFLKEANVFMVRLDKQSFLRKDFSLDLYKARQSVLDELYRIFDDVRDYNGGMIAKESELLESLRGKLKEEGDFNELVLENFFYSLTPVIARSMFEVKLLEILFNVVQSMIDQCFTYDEGYVIKFVYHDKYIFTSIVSPSHDIQKSLKESLEHLKLSRLQLVSTSLNIQGLFYLGFIFHSERLEERKRFCDAIRKFLENFQSSSS